MEDEVDYRKIAVALLGELNAEVAKFKRGFQLLAGSNTYLAAYEALEGLTARASALTRRYRRLQNDTARQVLYNPQRPIRRMNSKGVRK